VGRNAPAALVGEAFARAEEEFVATLAIGHSVIK
jgi:hypothetical protein